MKCAFGTLPICGKSRKSRLIQSPTRLWRYKTLLKRFMGDWYEREDGVRRDKFEFAEVDYEITKGMVIIMIDYEIREYTQDDMPAMFTLRHLILRKNTD